MTLPSGTRLGSYEVLAPLGAGGMGEVYRARDARLSREVALKVLPQEISADRHRLARFEQEGRSASALNHPNIVTVYEVGQAGEIAYIAMELVQGRTLRELLSEGPLPIKRILAVGAQTAEGLAKAHTAGIVHRDLKPENLMVSKDGYVKILDFGLSKLAAPGSDGLSAVPTVAEMRTESGTVLGTVPYMSPEQASGRPVDYRSDQFSLGSILYESVCGRRAFQKTTAAETMTSIIRDEPEPLAQLRPDVPLPLRWIVERCLAKDPDERYASTLDLARDLASLRDRISEATSAAVALVAAPARKGRAVTIAGGLALVALGLVSGWALHRTSKTSLSAPRFHRLTFRRGDIYNARFAPDGQTVLYGANWVGGKRALYLTRPQSPESSALDLGDGSYDILAVSPSGELAIRDHFNDVLSRVPMAGGTPRQVTTGIPYAGADWAPDGNDFVVVRNVGGRTRLEYPIGKVLLESAEELGTPRFSPDGSKIAFFEQTGGSYSVDVVETSGKGKKALSTGWASYQGAPCWTPGGKEIWFTASQQSEKAAIHAVDLAGNVRLVTRAPGMLELDDISREGRVLAAHHVMARVLMGRLAGDEKDRDLSWLDESVPADLSADGRTLLFDEIGQGGGAAGSVYMRKTDGSAAVRLGEGFGAALSPDGARVIAGRPRPAGLFVLPTGPGQPSTLPGEQVDILWVNWLPDSRRIVFSARVKDGTRTFIQDVEGGPPRPLGPQGMQLFDFSNTVSPDGKVFVAHTADGKAVLFPVEDGEMREAKGLNPRDRPIRWTPDGRLLYVFRRGESPARIFLVDPVTGSRTLFKEISPAEPTSTFSEILVTPDGKGYIYSYPRNAADLNIIEGLR